tara:strand:+ start:273 stop:815 length:543 start_codon:yes stop_codon:yes gene_type:complete
MRFNNFIKATTFFSTIFLVIILAISNQKEKANLRILIWDTPPLSLGSYLAISTVSGFILAYLSTSSLTNLRNTQPKQESMFKENNQYIESTEYIDKPTKKEYDNTLIERDINDPSPTINANFRIIRREGKTNNDYLRKDIKYNKPSDSDNEFKDQIINDDFINSSNSSTSDWNDQTFLDW